MSVRQKTLSERGLADVAQFTDNTGGTASNILAAGVGKTPVPIFIDLTKLANGDVLTTITPGFAGRVLAVDFFVHAAVTTAAKAADINIEIGTTNLTGGVVGLTSDNCTPAGAKVAGSAVTADNTFSASDTISIEAANVTAFVEGSGWLVLTLQNDDTRNAIASLAGKVNDVVDRLKRPA